MQNAVTSSTFVETESDHTLYAGWKSNTYTVTLSGDATTTAGTESVVATYGLAMPSITVPTRTGYTFGGYYTGGNGEGTQYYNSDGTSARNWDITADTILIAKWTAQSVTVTLDQQSGSGGTTSITATYGNAMPSITLPTRSGYAFAGYFTSTGGGGTQYYTSTGGSSRKWDQTADKTLYAYWISLSAKAFSYTGGIQSYTTPVAGIYKLEVWGAGGGNADSSAGGKGGYSCGYVKLAAGKTVYIGVGGKGTNPTGGYNGGGSAVTDSSVTYRGGGGGGATHMALQSGTLASIGSANASKILLVAGGGGGAGRWAISANDTTSRAGGNGGGTNGANGTDGGSNGATATSGAAFGKGGNGGSTNSSGGGGGGGGLYGGKYVNNAGGGGGSGYIGGVASFTYGGTTYSPSTTAGSGSAAATNGKAQITFVKAIDEADTLPTEWRYFHTGGVQTFQANKTGVYKLETWGAGGGSTDETGGAGGYSSGYIKLTSGDTLYVVVGGRGKNPTGGYNGGGSATNDTSVTYRGGGGGGATHIARVSGTLSSIGSGNTAQILIVAGGGGGAAKWATGMDDTTSRSGGNGGGANGETGGGYASSTGATSTSGNAFGQGGGGTESGGGGGGGFYGGYSYAENGGGGGSGYIGGVPAFTYNSVTYRPTTVAGSGSVATGDGSAMISFITE